MRVIGGGRIHTRCVLSPSTEVANNDMYHTHTLHTHTLHAHTHTHTPTHTRTPHTHTRAHTHTHTRTHTHRARRGSSRRGSAVPARWRGGCSRCWSPSQVWGGALFFFWLTPPYVVCGRRWRLKAFRTRGPRTKCPGGCSADTASALQPQDTCSLRRQRRTPTTWPRAMAWPRAAGAHCACSNAPKRRCWGRSARHHLSTMCCVCCSGPRQQGRRCARACVRVCGS
jgi:hypothetical protein